MVNPRLCKKLKLGSIFFFVTFIKFRDWGYPDCKTFRYHWQKQTNCDFDTLLALQQVDTPDDTLKKKSRLRDADITTKQKRLRDLWNGMKI